MKRRANMVSLRRFFLFVLGVSAMFSLMQCHRSKEIQQPISNDHPSPLTDHSDDPRIRVDVNAVYARLDSGVAAIYPICNCDGIDESFTNRLRQAPQWWTLNAETIAATYAISVKKGKSGYFDQFEGLNQRENMVLVLAQLRSAFHVCRISVPDAGISEFIVELRIRVERP